MALVKCNECGKDISTEAEACPYCGYPMKHVTTGMPQPKGEGLFLRTMNIGCAIILLGIGLVIVFIVIVSMRVSDRLSEAEKKVATQRGQSIPETTETAEESASINASGCLQGYSLEYNPPKGIWECVKECKGSLYLDADNNWKCDGVLITSVYPIKVSPKPSPSPTPVDNWMYYRGTSPIDDSPTIVLSLSAENPIQVWVNTYKPILYIQCREDKTSLLIDVGMSANPEYGLYNEHTVRIRLDDDRVFTERWIESTDNKALFAPRAITLARKLMKADRMLFEFTPFNSGPVMVTFDLRGLDKHLPEVAETCHWKL